MLYSIIDYADVFHSDISVCHPICRSTNPYDYIRLGYHIDNANLFGGQNNVSYNCDFSGIASGTVLDAADK